MNALLAQRILDIIYKDADVRRPCKDSITDWILDTQPRMAPIDATALLLYLAVHQPDVLERLKVTLHIAEDIAPVLDPSTRD